MSKKKENEEFDVNGIIALHNKEIIKEQSFLELQTKAILWKLDYFLNWATLTYGESEKKFIWNKLIPFSLVFHNFVHMLFFYKNMLVFDKKLIEGFIENNESIYKEELNEILNVTIYKDILLFSKDYDSTNLITWGALTIIFEGKSRFEDWFDKFWKELPKEHKEDIEKLRDMGKGRF